MRTKNPNPKSHALSIWLTRIVHTQGLIPKVHPKGFTPRVDPEGPPERVHPEGFTLIELLVAMAIIAVIAGAAWGNFFNSLSKGRDARRKDNLMAVAKALELYYNDTRRYPPQLPAPGTALVNPDDSSVIYMQKIPSDPGYPDAQYCYMTDGNGTYYKMYANLENRDDQSRLPANVNCDSEDYNYGITSTNVEP